jgi:protoheme IX farnesyltransferase
MQSVGVITRLRVLGPTLVDLVALTKPRVSALVVATAAVGMAVAPGHRHANVVVAMLCATAVLVGAANALNSWLERDADAAMPRTRERPLPAGRLDGHLALGFALVLALGALPVLAFAVNPLTFLLGLVALLSYAGFYTPLKYRSTAALLVGAVPGALPPLMGWTAATADLGAGGIALFAILFLWQLPHVLGLSTYRRHEYAAAGVHALPTVRGPAVARRHAIAWAALFVPVALWPFALGLAGRVYFAVALVLGLAYLGAALAPFAPDASGADRWGRRLFLVSLLHLPMLLVALLADAGG